MTKMSILGLKSTTSDIYVEVRLLISRITRYPLEKVINFNPPDSFSVLIFTPRERTYTYFYTTSLFGFSGLIEL